MCAATQCTPTVPTYIGDDDTALAHAHAHQCIQLISGIIPLVVLIGLNTRIYIAIKKRMQAREGTTLTYRISLVWDSHSIGIKDLLIGIRIVEQISSGGSLHRGCDNLFELELSETYMYVHT